MRGSTSMLKDRQGLTRPSPSSELGEALRACRNAFVGLALLSGMTNVLMLTGAFFMLEVYDRVVPSRSMPTLLGLAILAGILYAFLGMIDMIRGRLLTRVGHSIDESIGARIYDTVVRLPLKLGGLNDGMQPLRDIDQVRSFLSSVGPLALFDLPWMPLYLGIGFILHPLIGLTALAGAFVLIILAIATEIVVRGPTQGATGLAMSRRVLAETSRRNADVIVAMGMTARLQDRWSEINEKYLSVQRKASDLAGGLGAISRTFRLMLQSAVLGVGGYLVIHDQATAGIIIAGSILAARALAPVDLAISNWRAFVAARQSWTRLSKLLALMPVQSQPMALPRPVNSVTIEGASLAPPGSTKIVLQDVNLKLRSGDGLGIIGPSASGKSSLVKMLVGAWQPARGKVCLDGAALEQWTPDALGLYLGYLPQEVELLAGTVAENISRFEPEPDAEAIVAAAKAAGVHELIAALSDGYSTQVGEQGAELSAGQRQWIALARALYRDPFLVVLDEPNSNLDSSGEEALTRAILGVRNRGGVAVVVAHRPSALAALDSVLVLNQGRIQALGPKDEVLAKVLRRDTPRPLKVVPDVGTTHS
jgi:PrtD family type I secretion system ABC transporter